MLKDTLGASTPRLWVSLNFSCCQEIGLTQWLRYRIVMGSELRASGCHHLHMENKASFG